MKKLLFIVFLLFSMSGISQNFFHGWVVYGETGEKMPKATVIITDFDPWSNTDIYAPNGYYNSSWDGYLFEPGKRYQIHLRGPYYDYPGVLYSPESTCPPKFYWVPPTPEDTTAMRAYLNEGKVNNTLMNNVICLGDSYTKMDQYIEMWKCWMESGNYPSWVRRYYSDQISIFLNGASNPKIDLPCAMAGDANLDGNGIFDQ